MKTSWLVAFLLAISIVAAQQLSVSQMGYHPSSDKQVIFYSDQDSGVFDLVTSKGKTVASYDLVKPTDFNGDPVECQGNNPCLVGDFSDFTQTGTYYIQAHGEETYPFEISDTIYTDNMATLMKFFDAQKQQGSSFHEDMNSYYSPELTAIADGSFIMVADQAALSLIRMGSAYRRNPTIFGNDMKEQIKIYKDYLASLQGLVIEEKTDGTGFRLYETMKIQNAFVPGPTDLQTIDIYESGSNPKLIETVSVHSLCGEDDGSAAWDTCIDEAQTYYKCQIDEPCLNMSYIGKTGKVTGHEGYAVSRGWTYEFGCFPDVTLDKEQFNSEPNPCLVFDSTANRAYTTMTLLAFLEAYPAVYDSSPSEAQDLLDRSVATRQFIKQNYNLDSKDNAFYGAAMFLLYDYTGDKDYLKEAHGLRGNVDTTLLSGSTLGNEFYWEEYVRHKKAIEDNELQYMMGEEDPIERFRGKIFGDYKDSGPTSLDQNGERIFQYDNNIQFQNSRYMLIEGVMATKTVDMFGGVPPSESFIKKVADNQIAWITGMNGVQDGVAYGSPITSYSFILGIGEKFPSQYHSRYLLDIGYSEPSGGEVIGARGTGYQFHDGNEYVYFDGKQTILGQTLGALGNGYNGEEKVQPYNLAKTFKNGMSYIPGWINGVFDINTAKETDIIFNYDDDTDTYEFTETTNEMVATAVEYFAYQDAYYNNREPHELVLSPAITSVNSTIQNNTPTNNTVPGNLTTPGNTTTNTTTIPGNTTTNTTVPGNTTTNTTLTPDAQIVSSGQSILEVDNHGSDYLMYENETGTFSVELDSNDTVSWYLNGKLYDTTQGIEHEIEWQPSYLYSSNISTRADIMATTGASNKSWKVGVEFIINPYFDPSKGEDAESTLIIYVNKVAYGGRYDFGDLRATIENSGQDTVTLYPDFGNNEEVAWKKIYETEYGDNYIMSVTGTKNNTNQTYKFSLPKKRAYHRIDTRSSGSSSTSTSSSTRRTSSSSPVVGGKAELVYVTLKKDVVNVNETQTITLDAKNFLSGVIKVDANFITPSNDSLEVNLVMVNGSKEYGTWQSEFSEFEPGQYRLVSIDLYSIGSAPDTEDLENRGFYAISEEVGEYEELALVYTALDKSIINERGNVTISLDARDGTGIRNVTAVVTNNRNEVFRVPLALSGGDAKYGTWSGQFAVTRPYATYVLRNITLDNGKIKTFNITERQVYANFDPERSNQVTAAAVTTNEDRIENIIGKPSLPTLIGFGGTLMLLVLGILVFARTR